MFHKQILDSEWNERRFTQWMTTDAIETFEVRARKKNPLWDFDAERSRIAHVLRIEQLTRNIRSGNEHIRVLDFGCGFGQFVATCRKFGFRAFGVDRATPRINEAGDHIVRSLDMIDSDIDFHAITLFETLEHLDEPGDVLAALSSRMKVGGLLILETPDCSGVKSIETRQDYLKIHPLDHINAFTPTTLKTIAERRGFKNIPRGNACVASGQANTIKSVVKYQIGRGERGTQLYFRKTS